MPFRPLTGINTTPGPKKCIPSAKTTAAVKAPVARSLTNAALEGRLRALGEHARHALQGASDDTRGINTQPKPHKGGVIGALKKFLHGIFGRPVHHAPVRPDPMPVNDGVYRPGTSTTIQVGINTTPGGKKQNPTMMV